MDAGKIRLITLGSALAAVIGVEILARTLAAADLFSSLTVTLLARLAQIGLILALVELFQDGPAEVGLAPHAARPGIAAGLRWSLVFGGVVAIVGTVLLAAGISPVSFFRLHLFGGAKTMAVYFVTGTVVAPFAEELFFRGLLYGFFRRWGVVLAVILTTVVFALLHLAALTLPVTQVIGGIIFCLAYEKEKNLWTPYLIHALGNAAIFLLGLVPAGM
ncbi:MAG: CPBP family intramembrane glutamic endopeptidase [Desulfosudaceae bacterium]